MELVSVIVPCYNSENTILETLLSIREQSITNFECIIIDDFSTDGTRKIINSFISNDKRFKLILLEDNHGVSYARNIGLKKAKGRYLSFLDADDMWQKDFLFLSLKIREKENHALTHSSYYRFVDGINCNDYKIIKPPKIVNRNNILYKNHLPLLTVMIDKKLVGDFYFSNLRPEDYYLWCDLIRNKNLSSVSLEYPCAYYRISDKQRSSNKIKALRRLFLFYKNLLRLNIFLAIYYTFCWVFLNSLERLKQIIKINRIKRI